MINILKMAYRDPGRNRRRSFFSALALGLGLMLLLFMAGVVEWEITSSMDKSIQLQSGNLQVRASTYNEDKTSLAAQDLIESPAGMAAKISALPPVTAATPRLFASGIVAYRNKTLGVRVIGIDPPSPANSPFSSGLQSGHVLTADDRDGILIGKTLADKAGLQSGDRLTLLVNTANENTDQQEFTVRGVFSTGTPGYDETTVLLPLVKAQAITQAGDRASAIFVLLKDRAQTQAVVAAIQGSNITVKTFDDLNPLLVQFDQLSNSFMIFLDLIVLGITATVIVNTLIMAVFERTREIGILGAIGMRSATITLMFFAESVMLALGGIAIGLVLGIALVAIAGGPGIPIPDFKITGIMLSDTLHAVLTVKTIITLSLTALVATLLAAIYPAMLASRLEPVDALRGPAGGK